MQKKASDIFEELTSYNSDPRVRRYLTPKRVLWKNGNVINAENLLVPKTSQITLQPSAEACVFENKPGSPHAAILLDYGIELNGSVRLFVWALRNYVNEAKLLVRFGESADEAMTPIGVKNTTNDHSTRDKVMNVSFLSANETNESGFRFVYIELLEDDARIVFKAVEGVFIYRDIPYLGSFECNDSEINRIFNVAAYTAHLNMQEYLWDGIKRDRLVWIGDMQTEVMTIATVFGYNEVVPRSLDLIRDETPVESWMNGIPSYSIWWVFLHYDWYMSFGDLKYLKEQKPYLTALLKRLSGFVGKDGKETLDGLRFIDWPNQANPEATGAGLQAMLKMGMEKGARLMRYLRDSKTAAVCEKAAEKLSKYNPDPNGSKQAGGLLVCAGLSEAKEMNEKLLSVGGGAGFSTFLGYYTLAAMAMAGDYSGALSAMKEYWGGMLKMGATTFWEDFNLDWTKNASPIDELTPEGKDDIHGDFGAYCYVKFRHSLCHGWASGPVPFLSRFILGVTVKEPGSSEISVNPHLANLSYARGEYPTPYGNVRVEVTRDENGKEVTHVTAPENIKVNINGVVIRNTAK